MRNIMKVAKWEFKRNVTNKSFIISVFLTPILMVVFGVLPSLITKMDTGKPFTLYVVDELNVYSNLKTMVDGKTVQLEKSNKSPSELKDFIKDKKDTGYILLNGETITSKNIIVYTSSDAKNKLEPLNATFQLVLKNFMLKEFGLQDSQINQINTPFTFTTSSTTGSNVSDAEKIAPAAFAGILYFAIFLTGTMAFYSSLQDKRDKMVEVVLSSINSEELMQGKIMGYFTLSITQVAVWMAFGIPAAQMYFKMPIAKYIFIPELIPMLFFALAGFLMFSAMFVAIGATMEDVQSGSNFQGTLMMLPMLPVFFLGSIITDPSGTIARVCSFFPLTSPATMLLRLSLSSVPLWEVLSSGAILVIFILFIMKISGKIFKTAILMYDKTATAADMFRWIKS